jgi:hypothetical protein
VSITTGRGTRVWGALLAALALGALLGAQAQQPEHGHHGGPGGPGGPHPEHYDTRYNHNQYYFSQGAVVRQMPARSVIITRPGGAHYYYGSGVWYAPHPAGGFVVVAAPVGLFVPVLPPFYSTVWFVGMPYYYANDTYYVWRGDDGYEVVAPPGATPDPPPLTPPPDAGGAPPTAEAEAAVAAGSGLFVYPHNGQSPQQQADDQYDCHRWAASQTGFDPTQSAAALPPDQVFARRADYQRAMRACLEGRGYSVR